MVALTDIAPSTLTVNVGGGDVSVFGVSAKGIASLLSQFPSLKSIFAGDELKFDFTFESVLEFGPDVVAAVIAAGCGLPGDPKALEVAASIPVADQARLLQAIFKLTMPDGPGPLLDALNAIVGAPSVVHGKAPASK